MSRTASAQATSPAGLWFRLNSATSPCSQWHFTASLLLDPARQGWDSDRLRDGQCTYSVTQRRVRVTIAAVVSNSIKYSQCATAALVTRQVKGMRRIILSSVACLVLPFFSPRYSKKKSIEQETFDALVR